MKEYELIGIDTRPYTLTTLTTPTTMPDKPTPTLRLCGEDMRYFSHEDIAIIVEILSKVSCPHGPSGTSQKIFTILYGMHRLSEKAREEGLWLGFDKMRYREVQGDQNPDGNLGEFYYED